MKYEMRMKYMRNKTLTCCCYRKNSQQWGGVMRPDVKHHILQGFIPLMPQQRLQYFIKKNDIIPITTKAIILKTQTTLSLTKRGPKH